MPAIQLAKLRKESAQLAEIFDKPDEFTKELIGILDIYADHAHRTGLSGEPPTLLISYNVPKPVIRQILIEITPQARSKPDLTLEICDKLWEKSIFEFCWIAASILGQVSPDFSEPVFNRIQVWSEQTNEDRVVDILVDQGLWRSKTEAADLLFQRIEIWLEDTNPKSQLLGLRALKTLVLNANFENMPAFFRVLTPFLRNLPVNLRNDLRDVFLELASNTPVETAAYLRQFLENTYNTDAAWIARQCMQDFSPEIQSSLRQLLRESPTQT